MHRLTAHFPRNPERKPEPGLYPCKMIGIKTEPDRTGKDWISSIGLGVDGLQMGCSILNFAVANPGLG